MIKSYIYNLVILGLLIIILLQKYCTKRGTTTIATIKRDTTYIQHRDTVQHYTPKYITRLLPIEKWYTDSIYVIEPVDTAAILRDYFTRYFYSDTARVKDGTVVIQDTITQNKIANRRVFTALRSTVIREQIQEKPRAQLYGGFILAGSNGQGGVGVSLSLKTARQGIFRTGALYTDRWWWQAGYDFKITK